MPRAGLSVLRLFFSKWTPSTDLRLRDHPIHHPPWVQTQGLISPSSPPVSALRWTKAEAIAPPPSVPGEHHAQSTQPALMHTQRQKQDRWKSKPRTLTPLSLNCALSKLIQTARIPDHLSRHEMLSHMLLIPKLSL